MLEAPRGRLREGTSRSRQVTGCIVLWGNRPRKGDWSDLWLDVIMRRLATSDRSVVTAAEWVYSNWEFPTTRRSDGKTLRGNRPAPQPVHLLRAFGKWPELSRRMETG